MSRLMAQISICEGEASITSSVSRWYLTSMMACALKICFRKMTVSFPASQMQK